MNRTKRVKATCADRIDTPFFGYSSLTFTFVPPYRSGPEPFAGMTDGPLSWRSQAWLGDFKGAAYSSGPRGIGTDAIRQMYGEMARANFQQMFNLTNRGAEAQLEFNTLFADAPGDLVDDLREED